MNEDTLWMLRAAAYAAFAAVGGVIGHLMRTLEKRQKITFTRTALESVGAGFVGLLVLLLCEALGLSEQWTGVVVGVSGWLGASVTIRMLEGLVRKRLGVTTKEQDSAGNDPS